MVGGHVEATDLTLRTAATREAQEELGVQFDPAGLEPLSLVVDAREAAWFPLDALPEVNDHMRQHLDALQELLAR